MRRIYESGAVRRDDEDPFAPGEGGDRPQAMRSVDATAWSRRLLPAWVCHRAVSVDVESPDCVTGGAVPFVVTMRNVLPVPVVIETASARLWEWHVDGLTDASDVAEAFADDRRGVRFGRGETKRFRRRWNRHFRVGENEWEPAEPGEYTLGARLNVDGAEKRGLAGTTTVSLE